MNGTRQAVRNEAQLIAAANAGGRCQFRIRGHVTGEVIDITCSNELTGANEGAARRSQIQALQAALIA